MATMLRSVSLIEVQNGMVERNAGLPPERRIEFRVGIHVGDVVEESDGDLMGGGVNIAARLERIAKPGTICLSEDAYRKGSETVKSLSTAFLADLEEDWRNHGKEIFPILREKYPQAYFQGIVSLARFIRWDVESTSGFDRTLSPEEIMDKLEERVGPEGRKLFERRHTVSRRPGPSRRPMPASSSATPPGRRSPTSILRRSPAGVRQRTCLPATGPGGSPRTSTSCRSCYCFRGAAEYLPPFSNKTERSS
jgi:hypothetical protein